MRALIVFVSALAVGSAQLIAHPGVVGAHATQYHAQDELGQYSYGYAGGPSSKAETKTADGVVRGGYNYIDGNGLLQSVNYVADPVNGFRVAATNLPVGPAPVPALAVAPVARVAAPLAAPVLRAALPVAAHGIVPVGGKYIAQAAPLNNGAVHVASLPIPPADTPEVQAARLAHFAARG